MAEVRPLRGVRYDPQRLANIGRLIAPPYDTTDLTPAECDWNRPSFNIAQLENVDLAVGADSHRLAAARYKDWRRQGVLIRDEAPALYVHDHQYDDGDRRRHRRGLLARVRLEDWRERVILPHERTIPGPREERLERLRAVQANLSPLYLLYHDESGEIRQTLAAAMPTAGPLATGADINGARHQLARLDDDEVRQKVSRLFAGRTLFVADGHHRYEAALAYRDEQRQAGSHLDAPSEFVLAMLADIDDAGVVVRPTHRLIRHLPEIDPARFRRHLAELFTVETGPVPAGSAPDQAVCDILLPGEPYLWRLYPRADRAHETVLPADRSPAWKAFNVAVADSVILESVLGIGSSDVANHVTYTQDATAARRLVDTGEAQLALVFAPPSLPALARVAAAGDQLPPKSTYFDPKPPAGLVINDLSEN